MDQTWSERQRCPEITYYALLTDEGVPAGLIRRIHLPLVPLDESLRRDLSWRRKEFLRKYQLGTMKATIDRSPRMRLKP